MHFIKFHSGVKKNIVHNESNDDHLSVWNLSKSSMKPIPLVKNFKVIKGPDDIERVQDCDRK